MLRYIYMNLEKEVVHAPYYVLRSVRCFRPLGPGRGDRLQSTQRCVPGA